MRSPVRRRARALLVTTLALVVAWMSLPAVAATPAHEITAKWIEPPTTIGRGNPVVAEWRVNLNDGDNPPANEWVDDVTATFTVENAFFDEIPDICLTDGVTDASTISEDGRTLTCNFGTVRMGTAVVVQTPVVADGMTGDEIIATGTIGDASTDLPPILIENPFAMDLHWGSNYVTALWNDDFTAVDLDLQWTLRLGTGSEPGPDRLEYTLRLAAIDGSAVVVGSNRDDVSCSPFTTGSAPGHPHSRRGGSTSPSITDFVESCTLTQVEPGVFRLVLEGINYSLTNLPTQDSSGRPLPSEWNAVASGSVWLQIQTDASGSVRLEMDPVDYTSPSGLVHADDTTNNVTTKAYTLPGSWATDWRRNYTNSGGTYWDDTYRVSAGTDVQQSATNRFSSDSPADPNVPNYGACLAFDHRYVTFNPVLDPDNTGVMFAGQTLGDRWVTLDGGIVEYYVGGSPLLDGQSGSYDPNVFSCAGDDGWTGDRPADPELVKAVRVSFPHSRFAAEDVEQLMLFAVTTIRDDVAIGQDVWMFGSVLRNGTWHESGSAITATPDARYPNTSVHRDILRIIGATPAISKQAAEQTVTPGVPVEFTLTYSANGSGAIPDTVDGYEITDVLPLGMTYVEGSADVAPTVSVDDQGRQVLTWTLDGVATNSEHDLVYQAVADASVAPGTPLTNTAQSHYDGQESSVVSATVTTTTNGHTTILKTSDVAYIPNDRGDGVGSGSWTVQIESFDPVTHGFTDTIDILPYNGDGRGTSFSGSYRLDDVVLHNGGTIYYTSADPATLSDDPADASNGAAGNPDGNTVGWTTTRPDTVTAIRVIGGELAPGGSFAFQVEITTDGAEPEDAYVNRAQARAEHTELVMRTSAVLIVTAYVVEKTSDPASGSDVQPGQTITYTVTVTQQGQVPAGAWFTDDMSEVLDDATYNEDVTASSGEVMFVEGILSWQGELPVGGSATITYSVTVKGPEALRADGDTQLRNVVTSPGCAGSCTNEHQVGLYEYSKTAVVAPGSTVRESEVITYTVTVTQLGAGAVENASVVDDFSAVLDDARYNGDATATSGEVAVEGTSLSWNGDLAVDQQVTITYSVTVGAPGSGDGELLNQVSSEDERGSCVPAADENPDCRTSHQVGDFTYAKTSVAAPGTEVTEGDTITYTVTIRHRGVAPLAGVSVVDDLSEVLRNARWNDDAVASAGALQRDGELLSWQGDLAPGDVVTLTYSVTVGNGGEDLHNVVSSDDPRGHCVAASDGNEGCETSHPVPDPPLAETGAMAITGLVPAALALILAGVAALAIRARRGSVI